MVNENISRNQRLGASGERLARFLIEQSLDAAISPISPDRGFDGLIEFVSPSPRSSLLHLALQVKTGNSFARDIGRNWQVTVERGRLQQWKESQTPVLLVWVSPERTNEALWQVVDRESSKRAVFIPKGRVITPATKYDLTLHLEGWSSDEQSRMCHPLWPPLKRPLREEARIVYRRLMREPHPVSPLLGPVRISGFGWRHITSQGRLQRQVSQSLQLVPVIRWAIENSVPKPKLRRIARQCIGKWWSESRLVVFRVDAPLRHRAVARLELVLRETLRYRTDWMSVPGSQVHRDVVFESIYERERNRP